MSEQQVLLSYGQQQKTSDDYYTPHEVFDGLGLRFDLDVCAPPGGVPWVPADRYFTKEDDGLSQRWVGRIWMNPPFSETGVWVHRFIEHAHGIALLPHFKSYWTTEIWGSSAAITFPYTTLDSFVGGRVFFPIFLAAFGDECVEALSRVGVVRVRA